MSAKGTNKRELEKLILPIDKFPGLDAYGIWLDSKDPDDLRKCWGKIEESFGPKVHRVMSSLIAEREWIRDNVHDQADDVPVHRGRTTPVVGWPALLRALTRKDLVPVHPGLATQEARLAALLRELTCKDLAPVTALYVTRDANSAADILWELFDTLCRPD